MVADCCKGSGLARTVISSGCNYLVLQIEQGSRIGKFFLPYLLKNLSRQPIFHCALLGVRVSPPSVEPRRRMRILYSVSLAALTLPTSTE